jgi:hypothetical protein
VTWREVGRLGNHRIRSVQYGSTEGAFADLILAEGSPGIFSPLMKWSGRMPDPAVYEADGTQVLDLQRDDGGNVPMVREWTRLWGTNGPVRLEAQDVIPEAIGLVAPGYNGYDTGNRLANPQLSDLGLER